MEIIIEISVIQQLTVSRFRDLLTVPVFEDCFSTNATVGLNWSVKL